MSNGSAPAVVPYVGVPACQGVCLMVKMRASTRTIPCILPVLHWHRRFKKKKSVRSGLISSPRKALGRRLLQLGAMPRLQNE